LRTSIRILVRPGEVAREYVAGRRQAYVSPLRLFIIASAIVIPLMVMTGWFEKIAGGDHPGSEVLSVVFPALNLLSPFVGALVLKLLTPRMPYYHHLILCFCFGTVIVILGIPLIFVPNHMATIVYQLALFFGYGFFSIRDFFGYTVIKSIGVTVIFIVLWQALWQLLVLGVLAVA